MRLKAILKNIFAWSKSFAKRTYTFWFKTEINEERIRQLRDESLKYYYPSMRM